MHAGFDGVGIPCLSDGHCAPGFVCHPEKQLCVDARSVALWDAGEAPDGGGPPDAGSDAGEGEDAGTGELDGGQEDGGAPDGGLPDSGALDAGPNLPPELHPLQLSCEEETPCAFTLLATDDGPLEVLEGSVVIGPARGSVSSFEGLDAVYIPAPGTMGEDTFTVKVSDGELESKELTVKVRVLSRRSCAHLLLSGGPLSNGIYTLLPNGPGGSAVETYCEMKRAGGGWALALKVDGSKQTFAYDAELWTNEALFNGGELNLDDTEAKLRPFRDHPVAQTLVLMRAIGEPWATAESVTLKVRAPSLRELFAGGQYVPTTLSKREWLGLVPDSRLQANCGAQGFNVMHPGAPTHARARIGIVGNKQNDCTSPDSFVGVGTSVGTCSGPNPSAGNQACAFPIPNQGLNHVWVGSAAVFVRSDDFATLDPRPSCSAHHAAGRRIDGVYLIQPAGAAAPFPAYCDMSTDGGGWTLLMRIPGNSSSHVLENEALGDFPCMPGGEECKVSTETISQLLAEEGTQVFAIRPDGAYQPFFVRAEGEQLRWPENLEASNRAALLNDPSHAWILTSYRYLAGAELAWDADVGNYAAAQHYYPTLYAPEQAFFRGATTGLRAVQTWALPSHSYSDGLSGALWVRTSGYEHLGAAESCLAHRDLGRLRDGVYLVGDPSTAVRRVYCDMSTHGGGWTVLASYSGEDGEDALVSAEARAVGNPFGFRFMNLSLADKLALSAHATESLLVRAGGRWLHVDQPLFQEPMSPSNETIVTFPVNVTSNDGTTTPATVGWSRANYLYGGDFGISVRSAPLAPFDHHYAWYPMLNASCADLLLYSYSGDAGDWDVGYDVNTVLGSWSPTHSCEKAEGGRLRFYVAVR